VTIAIQIPSIHRTVHKFSWYFNPRIQY